MSDKDKISGSKGYSQMKDQKTHKDSRRKFLVKTSAVSLISALPATSVWGACTVSGALSGGSKVNNDCTTISLIGGRSPGKWHDMLTGESIASAFPYLKDYKQNGPNADNTRYECEKSHLVSVILAAQDITIPLGNNEHGQAVTINIKDALASSGHIAWNLAAVYLNAEFGFYSSSLPVTLSSGHSINNGADLISHLFALDIINNGFGDSDSYFGFTDGSTTYQATGSNC